METIFGMAFQDNKQALSKAIVSYGLHCKPVTIERHLLANDVGPIIDIPVLARICEDRHYAFAPCFTIISDDGIVLSRQLTESCKTSEPLDIMIWDLTRTLIYICPDLTEIVKELNIHIDRRLFYLIGHKNLACLSGISSTKFIHEFLKYGIDLNELIKQKGYRFPVVSRTPDIRVPFNNTIRSFLDLMMEFLDLAKSFYAQKEKKSNRGYKLD